MRVPIAPVLAVIISLGMPATVVAQSATEDPVEIDRVLEVLKKDPQGMIYQHVGEDSGGGGSNTCEYAGKRYTKGALVKQADEILECICVTNDCKWW